MRNTRAFLALIACLLPALALCQQIGSVSISPSTVTSGNSATGTVKLSKAAGSSGLAVTLTSSSTEVEVPSSVTIASGETSATFAISAGIVKAATKVTITGTDPKKKTAKGTVTVEPPVRLSSVTFSTSSVTAANPGKGTVTLTAAAPASGLTVNLSTAQTFVSVPESVKVISGAKTATFTVVTKPVAKAGVATIAAEDQNGFSASGKLTVLVPTLRLTALTVSPTSIYSTQSSTGTVTISEKAPKGGFKVNLSTMATTTVTIPMTVTVAAGETTATFTITANTVSSLIAAAINAADANLYLATANINVNPIVGIATTDARTYSPQTYTAAAGSTVTWTNISFMGHTVTSDTGVPGLASGNIDAGKTFTWTIPANAPSGTMYFYHCDYHGFAGNGTTIGTGMAGVIIVK